MQKWLRWTAYGLLAIIALQILYPGSRALPYAKINGQDVSFSDAKSLKSKLADTPKQPLILTIGKETVKADAGSAGVSADEQSTLHKVADYPWYWRLLPFSSVVLGVMRDEQVQTKVDKTTVEKYAEKVKDICSTPAHNAGLKVTGESVQLDSAKDGTACPSASLIAQLDKQTVGKKGLVYTLQLTSVKPKRSDNDVAGLLKDAKAIVAKELTVSVADKTYKVPKATVASWLMFVEKEDNSLQLDASADLMKKYFETIQKDIYIKPGVTYITTRDGIELSRVNGASGRGIDGDASAAAIKKSLVEKTGTALLVVSSLPPTLQYSRSYSNTPAGLQALITDLSKANNNMAISVRKLGDSGVNVNGDQQYHAASTYKLYVAYSVLKRIDAGQWTWDKPTSYGSVSQCFDKMILYSDNACAEWFGGTIGWSTVFGEARAQGLSNTAATAAGFRSTTNDLALFLQKLESNQLGLTEPSRARLLDVMKRQVYRSGIPAGVGSTVADKVGFLDSILNDAAIVYSPKGVYIITIMSDGSSWGAIANVARAIDQKINE